MRKILFMALAALSVLPAAAQSLNMDLTPVTSSLRTLAPDIVNIACFALLIVGVAGVVYKYYDERDKLFSNIIMVIFIVGILWGAGRIAINAFL